MILALMTMIAMSTPDPAPKTVEIIGHRGASFDAPENTIASIKLAWEQKTDAAEFDIYLSKDGQIVVIHDADTKRVGGRDKKVVAQTFDELRQLDVGKWKNPKFAGEKIPTLAELLATVPAGKRVFIEVKCGPEIMQELERVLKASKLKPEQMAIISFNAEVIAASKKARPDLKAYWIVSMNAKKGTKLPTADALIKKAKQVGADGLDLSAGPTLDRAFADKVKAAKMELYVWTVDDVATAKRMIANGVDGITTNRPGWLREQLAK